MAGFYIKSITAFGNGKKDASIEFNKKLNIITGYSDTGKTCILRCADFIFGRSTPPFDETTGYTGVRMVVQTDKGSITFTRGLGKRQVEVSSTNPDIDSGIYDIHYKKNQKKLVLNVVWLKLIGIDEPHTVPSNAKYEFKRLTWKTLRPLRFLDEDDIGRTQSIIEPVQFVEKTLFLSSLLFLLNGRDFSEVDVQKNHEIKKARREAIEEYVNKKIANASIRQEELTESLNTYEGIDVDAELERVMIQIQDADSEIVSAVNAGRKLLNSTMQINAKLAECDVLLSRYDELVSQYKSDIKRLTFIVDGEQAGHDVPENTICPFCKNGKIPEKSHVSYIKSASAELHRIVQQLNGLDESIRDVNAEKEELQKRQEEYQAERDGIETRLQEKLQPRLAELSKQKDKYRQYIEIQNGMKFIEDMADSWNTDLRNLQVDENDETISKYHPKDYFSDTFLERMDNYAKSILGECSYENLLTASFNLEDFDIVVNGGKKATHHGKGYRAFLNTVVALMFRKYLAEYAMYNPGILMIDTPLLGLDQGVNDAAPKSMRTALFKYLINYQNEGQLIVVENWEHIPKLNYTAHGATVTKFTKGRSEGRYGFLYDVK